VGRKGIVRRACALQCSFQQVFIVARSSKLWLALEGQGLAWLGLARQGKVHFRRTTMSLDKFLKDEISKQETLKTQAYRAMHDILNAIETAKDSEGKVNLANAAVASALHQARVILNRYKPS
jgi:hypothetical protein